MKGRFIFQIFSRLWDRGIFVLALSVCFAWKNVNAQPLPHLPGIGNNHSREVIDPNTMPWSILGRVQTELGVRCTGFAIAPTVMMTAAHCLWLPATGHYIRPQDVHVLMGYERGRYRQQERVQQFIIPSGYNPRNEAGTVMNDRAVLILKQPVIRIQERPMLLSAKSGEAARLVGYSQDRVEVLLGDLHCHTVLVDSGGLIHHDCEGTHGVSGAPLWSQNEKGQWGVSGIVVEANVGKGGEAIPVQ
ncbi:trypsin-like serine protease [Swingsia samuiensis]|uniref:Trypsin-like serine protease n=2 Tax=Swingsia samuiensis TaxID=1293412 RepID=A0A4Y6UNZ3_9PROT|nr:trypsin-like serine protease [Swingsia samuiensis]